MARSASAAENAGPSAPLGPSGPAFHLLQAIRHPPLSHMEMADEAVQVPRLGGRLWGNRRALFRGIGVGLHHCGNLFGSVFRQGDHFRLKARIVK